MSGKGKLVALATYVLAGMASGAALADQYHYNNVLVGTRAVGMGGAFGGIADDASGLYYNPAGLAFALSNDIQGSANAFYKKKTTYLRTIDDLPFEEESSGSLTPFFGGLQKLDRYVDGLVFAFGVYYVDGDLKDQDTTIEGKPIGASRIKRYHRTSNARAGSYYAGAAIGYRPIPNVSIGLGLSYYNSDELVQEYQYAKQSTKKVPTATDANGNVTAYTPGWSILTQNVREHLVVFGMQPVFGVQVALPAGFSAGLTIKKGLVASQGFESATEQDQTLVTDAQNDDLESKGAVMPPTYNSQNVILTQSKKPIGSLPMEMRLGFGWFASPTLLWAFDIVSTGAVTDADKSLDPYGRARFNKRQVTNFATGIEWYVAPAFPLRLGLFTNNDARPKVAHGTPDANDAAKSCAGTQDDRSWGKKYCGQPDHIDYYGGSLFIAWVQPNSQISAGAVVQTGKGEAQKLGDYHVQNVKSSQYQFAFSATHNL